MVFLKRNEEHNGNEVYMDDGERARDESAARERGKMKA